MASFAMGGGAHPTIEWQWNDDGRRYTGGGVVALLFCLPKSREAKGDMR